MERIVVLGGGGHAKVLISILKKLRTYRMIGYTDLRENGQILGIPHLGGDDILSDLKGKGRRLSAAIGIGNTSLSRKRMSLKKYLEDLDVLLPSIISPDSVVNEDTRIGRATVVFDGAVVNSGARIGDCCIVNTNSTVEHDCVISDNGHIAPGASLSGGVIIGENTLIGTGATIIQNVHICGDCVIGAGAVVLKDIDVPGTYIGVPAVRLDRT
jgi:sugar O-acyltransferase (sialic acid O-acetyltransferase NeuD family)